MADITAEQRLVAETFLHTMSQRATVYLRNTGPTSLYHRAMASATSAVHACGLHPVPLNDVVLVFEDCRGQLALLSCTSGPTASSWTTLPSAVLSEADIVKIYLLAVALISDPNLLGAIGTSAGAAFGRTEPSSPFRTQELAIAHSIDDAATWTTYVDALGCAVPEWSVQALYGFDTVRRVALNHACHEAFQFLWLHEFAHLIQGHHTEDAPRGIAAAAAPTSVLRQWELDCDAFAGSRILEGCIHTNARGLPTFKFSLSFLGCMLPVLLQQGMLHLASQSLVTSTAEHPSLLFRAIQLQELFGMKRPGTHSAAIAVLYSELAQTTHLFGHWLQPLLDDEAKILAQLESTRTTNATNAWSQVASKCLSLPKGPDR
jgi:hypothetical protein